MRCKHTAGMVLSQNRSDKVKTPEQLFQLYLKSVGRGANLLLNVPPDGRGLITSFDSAALVGFRKLRKESFKVNLAKIGRGYFVFGWGADYTNKLTDESIKTFETASLYYGMGIEFKKSRKINCIILKENIRNGQNSKSFTLLLVNDKTQFLQEITGTTIGNKRVFTFPASDVNRIGLTQTGLEKSVIQISEIEAYLIDESLIEK